MPLAKELVVTVHNTPGQVHAVSRLMGDSGINIIAVAVIAQGPETDLHMLVTDAIKAEKILKAKKYRARTGDVILLELEHSPGELARLTKIIADAGVNIELLYGSGSNSVEAQLVLGVDDIKKAAAALQME